MIYDLADQQHTFVIRIKNLLMFFLGLGALLNLDPYFIWGTSLVRFISITIFILSIFYFTKNSRLKVSQFYLLSFSILFVFLLNFSSNGFILYIDTTLIVIFSYLLIDNNAKMRIYNIFYRLFTLSLIPGLIIFFLSFIGVKLPWEHLEVSSVLKEEAGLFYRNYWGSIVLSNQIYPTGLGEIYRFSSIYGEPGVVGTVAGLILASNRFKLQTLSSKIILVSGVLSFSLAFYLLASVYIILKRPGLIVKLLFPALFIILFFYSELKQNLLIERYFFNRFERGVNDIDSINNRTSDCFKYEYDRFIQNGNIFIGNGAGASGNTGCDVSSYLTIVYDHGFLGLLSVFTFYFLLYFSLGTNLKSLLYLYPLIIVFLFSLYQRPAFFSIWMIVIFCGAVLNENENIKTV